MEEKEENEYSEVEEEGEHDDNENNTNGFEDNSYFPEDVSPRFRSYYNSGYRPLPDYYEQYSASLFGNPLSVVETYTDLLLPTINLSQPHPFSPDSVSSFFPFR